MKKLFILLALVPGVVFADGTLSAQSQITYTTNGASVGIRNILDKSIGGSNLIDAVSTVSTTEAQVALSTLVVPGSTMVMKLLSTQDWASCQAGISSGVYFVKLTPTNTWALFPMNTTNLFAKAGTNTVEVRFSGVPNQ